MQQIWFALSAAAVLLAPNAIAQDPATVAGVWHMDATRSESAHQAVPIGPVTLIIKPAAGGLSIETRTGKLNQRRISSETLTYKLDGSESSSVNRAGGQVKTKAHWDGAKLVTETAQDVQGSTVTTMYVFSVDPGGKELTVDKSLTVQHGYQFEGGAANTGKATDVFTRSKPAVKK
jgi:hypothetical protein